jgi:hypothetical protein
VVPCVLHGLHGAVPQPMCKHLHKKQQQHHIMFLVLTRQTRARWTVYALITCLTDVKSHVVM